MRNRLRVLRAERGWTQAQLAEQLGVSRQTVNALETGRYNPSLVLAFTIADLFGTDIPDIFIWDGHHGEDGHDGDDREAPGREPRV